MNEIKTDTKTNLFLKSNPNTTIGHNFNRKRSPDKVSRDDAKISITDATKDFTRIRNDVYDAPDIDDSSKLAKLKKEIKEGTYKIDYEKLAEKIILPEL